MASKNASACLLLPLLLLIPLLNAYASPLSVSTDKPEYNRGDMVNISISAPPNCELAVQVLNPVGGVEFVDQVRADSSGRASTSFRLSPTAIYGTYTVYVSGCGASGSTTFRVVEVYVPPPPPPPPTPPKKSTSMTLSVDRESIMLGESVTARCILSPGLNVTVRLRITCPNGSEVSRMLSSPYGAFTFVFKPDAPGYWTMRASWEGNDEYEGCVSNTVGVVVRTHVSLEVLATPSITGVGGTVIVYVTTTPPLANRYLIVAYISNRTRTWTTIGSFETGSNGVLAIVFRPRETGEYWFRVDWVGDPAYTPASANSSKVLVMTEPVTPEDIVNMLSQLRALEKQLGEKESQLEACGKTITDLQKNIAGLQAGLASAESRISSLEKQLAETQSKLSEAESRAQFTTILGLVAGVLIGLIIGYLAFRRRPGAGRFPLPPE